MKPRCYAAGPGCDGPLELHHLIKKQRIRKRWQTLMAAKRRGGPKPWSLTKALADPRNLVYACKRTHHLEETAVPLPDGFWDFVAEYDLEPLLPRWLTPLGAPARLAGNPDPATGRRVGAQDLQESRQ